MNNSKILIVGIGNPGKKYEKTPHNAGHTVINTLLQKLKSDQLGIKSKDSNTATVFETQLEGKYIILAKTKTFMNNSGSAVKELADTYNTEGTSLWVIQDDVDLPLGRIRVSFNATAGGHRGIQDIIDKTETKNFYRFRIGVREENMPQSRPPELMRDFVTKKARGKTKKQLNASVELCADIILKVLETREVEIEPGDYNLQ